MGFDTIEINLVLPVIGDNNCSQECGDNNRFPVSGDNTRLV